MHLRGRFLRVCMRPLPVSFSLLSKVRSEGYECDDIRVTDTGTVLSAPILYARIVKRDGIRRG